VPVIFFFPQKRGKNCPFISILLKFGFSCLVCDPVMGDEGKLYVPPELVSVYREKVTNPVDVVFVLGPYDTISFSLTPSQLYIYIYIF